MIGFPENGSPFVELIVLIDFQNTSPNDEQYKYSVIVAHTYMIFEKDGEEARNWEEGGGLGGANLHDYKFTSGSSVLDAENATS